MPSADQIADAYTRAYQAAIDKIASISTVATLTAPTSDSLLGPAWSFLTKAAEQAAGAEFNIASKGLGDLTHFVESDIIKPLESVGTDVLNVGKRAYDIGDMGADFLRNVNRLTTGWTRTSRDVSDVTKSISDTSKSVSDALTSLFGGGLGGYSSQSALGGFQLPPLTGANSGSGGGSDYTPIIIIGGLVGAGLVVYYLTRKKK